MYSPQPIPQKLEKFLEDARRKAAQQSPRERIARQLHIPGLGELMRAMPNHIARSSLYAPIARGKRKFHHDTLLAARCDAVMTYTGEQLDEADADLTFQLIFEARSCVLGQPVTLNRASLLRAIGRNTGKSDYEWLHRRMKAMTVATLFVETTKYRIGHTEAFHIIQRFCFDDDVGNYTFSLDPRWVELFGNREYALLDWNKRLAIKRGQNMAKALQRLVATSSDKIQHHSLKCLKDKFHYASPMHKFKESMKAAMSELERVEIIANARFGLSTKRQEQVVWLRL